MDSALDLKTAALVLAIGLVGATQTPPAPDVIPPGWAKSGSAPPDYILTVDYGVVHSGLASGQLRSRRQTTATGGITQRVKADLYRGKRIRVSAWLRTQTAQSVLFFVRVDGPGMTVDFDNTDNAPLPATSDWANRELVLDVPRTALGITFGVVMEGMGIVWLDDVALEIVPASTRRTDAPPAPEPPDPEREKMLRQRYSVEPTSPRNMGFEEPIKGITNLSRLGRVRTVAGAYTD